MSADGLVSEAAMGIFRQQLTSYKRSLGIQADNPDSILQSLPQTAYSLLYERYGDALTAQAESELLTNIEAPIVRPENKLSYVLRFKKKMKQDSDQPVAHFSASVRAAARRCKFKVSCSCQTQVSYEGEIVLYQFMSGLNDLDVQADLLAKPHLSLPEAEAFAIDREMAKRSQDAMHYEELSRIKSTYKRQKAAFGASKAQACPGLPEAGLCTHCGEAAHANRRTQCKAFNHTCTCGRRGHFLKVCFRKGQPGTPPRAVAEAIETLPAPDLARPAQDGLFELSTKFVAETDRAFIDVLQSPQSNRLPITITVDSSSMPSVRSGSDDLRTATCTAVADTGATVTCCGPDVLANLGVARTSLLRSSISLYAANKSRLTVWGRSQPP